MDRNYNVIIFISKSRKPRVTIFAGTIKIVTIFIKIIFKDSKEVKRIRIYVSKWNLHRYLLMQQNLLISGEIVLMLAELKRCVT